MNIEYEIRFYPIDRNLIQKKLIHSCAILVQKEILMKRYIYYIADKKWLRIRDEGNKITATIKQITDTSIDGTKELEIEIKNFSEAVNFFDHLGLTKVSYQENYRETWNLNDAIITIDTWPQINSLIEIEGKNSAHVFKTIESLDLDISNSTFESIEDMYKNNNINLKEIKYLSFNNNYSRNDLK